MTILTTLPVLTYFDKDKDHIIQTDASKTGLSAVLLQEGQAIVYASRVLTDCNTSLNNIGKIPVYQITQIAPASPERLQEICEATSKDPTLRLLADIVHEGWPKMTKDCSCSIQSYCYFRDELTCEEGSLYKGVRLIIPQSEQASTLKVLHLGHYAVNKMNLRARDTVYWPGISEDIKVTYHRCDTHAKLARTQQKETLQYVETLKSGWEQLSLDLFSLKNTLLCNHYDFRGLTWC